MDEFLCINELEKWNYSSFLNRIPYFRPRRSINWILKQTFRHSRRNGTWAEINQRHLLSIITSTLLWISYTLFAYYVHFVYFCISNSLNSCKYAIYQSSFLFILYKIIPKFNFTITTKFETWQIKTDIITLSTYTSLLYL